MKKALRDRARAEREAAAKVQPKKPGSVMLTFIEKVTDSPWWRFWDKEEDFRLMFPNAEVAVSDNTIRVQYRVAGGTVTRLFNWRDVKDILAIPPVEVVAE